VNTATRLKARASIIKVPDSSPGILFIGGEQKSFIVERIWRLPIAPAANMVVDVDLDSTGNVTAVTAVDAQALAKERLNQFSGVAQEQGKQVADMAKASVGALAARMGKVPLIATVSACVAWFLLPAGGLNLGFLGSKSLTFWELLAIDLSNPMNMATRGGSHDLWAMLGIAALVAPFTVPFLKHPQAKYLNAMLLAFLVLTPIKTWWDFSQALGPFANTGGGVPDGALKEISSIISVGAGTYVLIIASIVLAVQAFKRRPMTTP
jgi:hypothetical protein